MKTFILLVGILLSLPAVGQTKELKGELDKKKRETARVEVIEGQGVLMSYSSTNVNSMYSFDISSGFVFYDLDLKQKWKLDGLAGYSIDGKEEVMKFSSMYQQGAEIPDTRPYTLTDDGKYVYMHNFSNNEVTMIDVSTGKTKTVKSTLALPEEMGYINYSSDGSNFIVSFVTYTKKKGATKDFDSKLFVARYTPELKEEIQETEVAPIGSSKHKIRIISSSGVESRKWELMGASNNYVLLQDGFILEDEESGQNYRRLLSIDLKGETKELLIPYGDYDKKSEKYFGETFCDYQTNNKLYNVYIDSKSTTTAKINIQIIDLDLTVLSETSIETKTKASKMSTSIDINMRASGQAEITVGDGNSLYRIEVSEDYNEINHHITEAVNNDCVKKYFKYSIDCYDYEVLSMEFSDLKTFLPKDEAKTKKSVKIKLIKSGNCVYLIKVPQMGITPDSFFEIYRFEK